MTEQTSTTLHGTVEKIIRSLDPSEPEKAQQARAETLGVRQPLPEPVAANQVWSVDFMTDALSSGRRFRTLNIVDDYTRECLEAVKEYAGARKR